MIAEQDLHEYNKWLMEVWNPGQLYIPFSADSPSAFLDYSSKAKKLSKADVDNFVCDDWIHNERIKMNDDNYCPICGKQLQEKNT